MLRFRVDHLMNTAIIEKCPQTGAYVAFVTGFPGVHSQGETLDELHANLKEVIEMVFEDGDRERP